MCGIAGVASRREIVPPAEVVAQALRRLAHRGPDGSGQLMVSVGSDAMPGWAGCVLGHRRLAIIDLSAAAAQPMSFDDRDVVLTYNGEIYNYLELRSELRQLGYAFRTDSDTEVLQVALECWGIEALERLRGMFAFAAWSKSRRELLLARDGFGIKPLYYSEGIDGTLSFASEVQTLVRMRSERRHLAAGPVFDFLRYGRTDHSEATLVEGVRALSPGAWMRWRHDARPSERGHFSSASSGGGKGTPEIRIRDALLESVRLHARSDVPVGILLSGGLDSSLLAAMYVREAAGRNLPAVFTWAENDPSVDESPWAAVMARHLGVTSVVARASDEELRRHFDDFVLSQDLPASGPSVYAQYFLFRSVHEAGIKVVLDGQGSDELFCGYGSMLAAAAAQSVAEGHFGSALASVAAFPAASSAEHRRVLANVAGRVMAPWLRSLLSNVVGEERVPKWLAPEFGELASIATAAPPVCRGRDALSQERAFAVSNGSLPMLLRFEDRNSMRWSVESRVPFCDVGVSAAARELPTSQLVRRGVTKRVLREVAREYVPAEIITRPKRGFATSESRWKIQLGSMISERMAEALPRLQGIVRQSVLNGWRQRPATLLQMPDRTAWRIVNLALWAESADATL